MDISHANTLRRCLETCDIAGVRALWAHIAPGLPQPTSDAAALAMIHRARTEAQSIALKLRAYSHRWLLDHDMPSGLPDELKPRAEQIYPKIVEAVGISANFRSKILRAAKPLIERAMGDAVEECYADGLTDPAFIRERILAAKDRETRQLFGKIAMLIGS